MWQMIKELFKFLGETMKAITYGLEEVNRGLESFNKEMDARKLQKNSWEIRAKQLRELEEDIVKAERKRNE